MKHIIEIRIEREVSEEEAKEFHSMTEEEKAQCMENHKNYVIALFSCEGIEEKDIVADCYVE